MPPFSSSIQLLADLFGPAIIVLCVLTAAELLWPRGEQTPAARLGGIVVWLIYIPCAAVLSKLLRALWDVVGLRPMFALNLDFRSLGVLGLVVAPVLGAMLYDFFFYVYHRAQHRWLWRWHAVHHSIRDLNAVNSYHHVIEPALQTTLLVVPATLLFCDTGTTIPLMAILMRLHASWIHSPTRLHLGPLSAVVCDNRFHRIHHSLEEAHYNRNFGAFTTLWDRLFGTAHIPRSDEWPATGLQDVAQPASVREWLTLPFRLNKTGETAAAVPALASPGMLMGSVDKRS